MYTVNAITAGKTYTIHNPKVKELMLAGNPYFEVGDNINGCMEFQMQPTHPYYDKVKRLVTDIYVYNDGEEQFAGRVLYDDSNMCNQKDVFVEGELAFLCDSIQRPARFQNITVRGFLERLIQSHNSQVEERKQFAVGIVTVTDSNDSLYRYTNWENTREAIQEKLIKGLGGHIRIRKANGVRYIDYLRDSDFARDNSQTVRFGKNLLDFSKNMNASDLATCVIPLGAQLEGEALGVLDLRLTIEDVNGGIDYLYSEEAVKEYGRITVTVTFDEVTVAENLVTKGLEYLKSIQFEKMVLELKAIDMHLTDSDVEEFKIGDQIRCISPVNGMDAVFPLRKKKIYINDISKNTVTLGDETRTSSYTSNNRKQNDAVVEVIKSMPTKTEVLQESMKNAQDIINQYNQSGHAIHTPEEFIVADTEGVENARMLWRWGLGGFAHYSQGYDGPCDGIAITMDGHINGKMLLAESVMAAAIDIGYRKEVEDAINDAEYGANTYTDGSVKTAKEVLETSIRNTAEQIQMSVTDNKSIMNTYNYTSGGDNQSIDASKFTFSIPTDWGIGEVANLAGLHMLKTSTANTIIRQDLGELPEGEYRITFKMYFPAGKKPNSVAYGFESYTTSAYFSSLSEEKWHTFTRTVKIKKSSRVLYMSIAGSTGKEAYVTDIRVLRDVKELIDDVDARITIEAGKITQSVNEFYEANYHDYCVDGSFENGLESWYANNPSYVTAGTHESKKCACINASSGTGNYVRQTFEVTKKCKYRLRLKLATDESTETTARARIVFGGTTFYTAAGEIGNAFKEFEFECDMTSLGQKYLYVYCYTTGAKIYVTDIQILGFAAIYNAAQIQLTADSIVNEVRRATGTEEELKGNIEEKSSSYNGTVAPTTSNYPYTDWKTTEDRLKHVGDLYLDTTAGKTYVFAATTGGLNITFSSDTQTEANYDKITIYYQQNGKFYQSGSYSGNELKGKTVSVPTNNFWIRLKTDGSATKYGFKINSITSGSVLVPNTGAEITKWYTSCTEKSGSSYPESTHEYANNIDLTWHYTYGSAVSSSISYSWRKLSDQELADLQSRMTVAETKITQTADAVTIEATRAKKQEDALSASIKVAADNIELKVSKGTLSSSISAESGSINIKSNRISISSTNFTLTAAGYATMKGATISGSLTTGNTSSWWNKVSNATITGGYGSSTYGTIDFAGGYSNNSAHTLRLRGNSRIDLMSSRICVGSSYNAGTVYEAFSGSRNFITRIQDNGGGSITWWTASYEFKNGIMM